MKIYTKTGDAGQTSLFGGVRTNKNDPRIEAYGTVDELNSVLGIALSFKTTEQGKNILNKIQQNLFVVGADLATPEGRKERIKRVGQKEIDWLEAKIDDLQSGLPELKSFILPGGSKSGSYLHLARTVCRRAERAIVSCRKKEAVSDHLLIYVNRLSDLLFVLARHENHQQGIEETPWKPMRSEKEKRKGEK